jgi:ABC-type sugar transport system substrate-binding protein
MHARTMLSLAVLLLCLTAVGSAQQQKPAAQPAIPVYIVCPYHEDSLRTVYESAYPSATSALGVLSKRTDTLTAAVQKSSAQMSSNLAWIYGLLILGTLMNIVMLVSTLRMKREIAEMRAASRPPRP